MKQKRRFFILYSTEPTSVSLAWGGMVIIFTLCTTAHTLQLVNTYLLQHRVRVIVLFPLERQIQLESLSCLIAIIFYLTCGIIFFILYIRLYLGKVGGHNRECGCSVLK